MKLKTKDMAVVGIMASFMAVVSVVFRFYPLVFGTIPFSLLPLVVVLTGGILGARLGAWSVMVYILMGLAGLPVFATEPFGGITYVLKPTFGFLLGYIPAVYVSGLIVKRKNAGLITYCFAMLMGMTVIYLCGLPYLYLVSRFYLGQAISMGMLLKGMSVFMALDVVKALVAAVIAMLVARRLPQIGTENSKNM